uniref:Nuclear receptor binding protein 2 n=1 Tax=Lynx canadensis TaxID=61383 RepID=A0A667HFP7_LYNCA
MAAPEPAPRRGREREREDESEDESDILEESPCGRWQKRREQVNQGNMPGVQSTFLAMDTEEGVEVVWNELHFRDRKAFATHEVIFITEYVSSGSLKQFLKKTKKNHKAMNARAWKRWCTQILSALSFLHACNPPIIHGNLTSDTIFIQHNGLIKIGSVWHRIFSNALPDDLRSPIRVEREEPRNLHFFPPEYGEVADGTAVDIFSFGMCALEMAVLEIQANGDTRVTEEAITRARHSLSDPNMREFVLSCLARDPSRRPSAHNLLFHRVLFEVHSLKLLAAHCFLQHQYLMPENVVEEKTKAVDLNAVLAELPRPARPPLQWRYSEVSYLELDKFLEDVRNGIYPLMNFAAARPLGLPRVLAPPPEETQKAKTPTPEPFDSETRKVIQMQCNLERSEDKARWHLTLLLVLEDRLHRQLTYDLLPTDSAQDLAAELVHYGFVHEVCGQPSQLGGGHSRVCTPLSPHAFLPPCRMTGPSWLPSWKAPSSSTLELSRDLPTPAPRDQPRQPAWGSSALAQGSEDQGLSSAYMLGADDQTPAFYSFQGGPGVGWGRWWLWSYRGTIRG